VYLISHLTGQQILIPIIIWWWPLSGGGKNRERLALNKQISHRFLTEMFNPKKLIEVKGKEKYCVEIPNISAA
jgi:hypothetical protein